jgi:HK97 family phage major capsid protein
VNLKEQYQKLLLDAREIADRAEKEGRDFTADERQQVANLLEEAKAVKGKIDQAAGDAALRQQIGDLNALFEGEPPAQDPAAPGGPGRAKRQTIGEQFVDSPQWRGWMKQIGGRLPEQARGLQSPPVEFDALLKDLITGASDASAGAFVETDYTRIYEPLGRYALNLFDLISRRTTTSDLVHFVRQTTRVQEAAGVPEANVTEYSGATGEISGLKPEGAMAFEPVTTPVETIAVWIPATKRALSDAAQLRGLIDQELRDDCLEELEQQMINGTGLAGQLTGLANTAGVLAQAWNTNILTTTRQAITTLLVTGRQMPTAWLIHPQDWETVDLLQDANNRYYWQGPRGSGPPQLWGVPVVQSQSLTQGTGYLGNWRKMVLWDREQATITVSDSHEDFFIRNMVAILCELRAALGVIRPSAFVDVPFESGS